MRLQDALPLVHVPVTASRGRQSRAEASDQRSATGVGRCGLRGGAYLDRRATSSLRCAWRVSSTRSRMLGLRSSFGADMAAVPPASGQWIVRSRPRGWVWWCRWRLANCEVATGERCENTAEGGPRLYTRHAACNRSPWRPVRGRVAGGVGATIAYVCVRVTVWCDPARQAAGAWVPAEAVSGSSQGLVSFPGVA